ncbi:MAG: hypothetical protein KCHDKBKB_00631 [Elusimicrobia bacterium]|nr:hypothetical protein [Elusimicrobiota bacterium]
MRLVIFILDFLIFLAIIGVLKSVYQEGMKDKEKELLDKKKKKEVKK